MSEEKAGISITPGMLKTACEEKNYDLLDLYLETNKKLIDNNSLFTDTWGEWWGLLHQVILDDSLEAVNVLLKHGARVSVKNWGDCIEMTALELAEELQSQVGNSTSRPGLTQIIRLLKEPQLAAYQRKTEPEIKSPSAEARRIDQALKLQAESGLRFQDQNFE